MEQNIKEKYFLVVLTIALLSVPGYAANISAQGTTKHTEYEVKAAFLYNFAKFVEWPSKVSPGTSGTIVFGILGDGPMNTALGHIKDRQVKGGKVVTRHFKHPRDLTFCHVLFISQSEATRLGEILKSLKGSNTLTVGEVNGFAQLGGMINLIIVENKVRFEINVKSAEEAGLKVSSRLLQLARIVQDNE